METKNREKLLLIAALTCGGLWLLNLLVVSPLSNAWDNRTKRIATLRKEISDGTMLLRRQETVRGQWMQMETNALSGNPTVAERQFVTAFDRWVASSGVTEGSFRPQVREADEGYSTIECRADVAGTSDTISHFLYDMAKDPIGVKLDSCELTAKDETGRQWTLGMDLSVLILPASNQ